MIPEISFKAQYIGNSVIQDRNNKDVVVSSVKLDPNSKNDVKTVEILFEDWFPQYKGILIDDVYYDFIDYYKQKEKKDYYALTTQNNNFQKLDPDKILGIAEYSNFANKNYNYIDYIQVNPKYMANKQEREYKNIGSALLDTIKNLNGYKNIYLNSIHEAVDFYTKNGFKLAHDNIEEPLMVFERTV